MKLPDVNSPICVIVHVMGGDSISFWNELFQIVWASSSRPSQP